MLLIIFMVITPLRPVGLPGEIPQNPATQRWERGEQPLVLTVGRGGTIDCNGQRDSEDAVWARLGELIRLRADRTVFVRGAGDLEFGEVARVIDRARGVGAERFGLLGLSETLP